MASVIIMALLGIPIYTLLVGILPGPGPNWSHLITYLLPHYISNTLLLVIGTSILTLIWGIPAAWLVSTFDFKGRKAWEWLLILPLTIPTYIMAFTYAGILDYAGPIQTLLRNSLNLNLAAQLDILNLKGAIWVLSLALFPYVYVISRMAFITRFRSMIEASRLLGAGPWRSFFKVILPVSRPAIAAGLFLVIMEVLNDYGAVKYFGVRTFTTGIFRSWFSYEDIQAAIYLSSILLLFVFVVISIERKLRGEARFHSSVVVAERPTRRKQLTGFSHHAAVVACAVPAILGFVLPAAQLFWWALKTYDHDTLVRLLPSITNSFSMAALTALLCLIVGVVLIFAGNIRRSALMKGTIRISTMGYAVPGAIIAIGVLVPMLSLDRFISSVFSSGSWGISGLILTGSVIGLTFAYVVRFLAVAYNPLESGFGKIGTTLNEAAATLGSTYGRMLLKVNFPLLKGALLSAGLLVFIDVLKELPLTLILRPFNFDTLATKAFELASDELVSAAATPSLIIILTGIIPIQILNRMISHVK